MQLEREGGVTGTQLTLTITAKQLWLTHNAWHFSSSVAGHTPDQEVGDTASSAEVQFSTLKLQIGMLILSTSSGDCAFVSCRCKIHHKSATQWRTTPCTPS